MGFWMDGSLLSNIIQKCLSAEWIGMPSDLTLTLSLETVEKVKTE
jgi:hypothetical protein